MNGIIKEIVNSRPRALAVAGGSVYERGAFQIINRGLDAQVFVCPSEPFGEMQMNIINRPNLHVPYLEDLFPVDNSMLRGKNEPVLSRRVIRDIPGQLAPGRITIFSTPNNIPFLLGDIPGAWASFIVVPWMGYWENS